MREVYGELCAHRRNVPPYPDFYDAEGSQYQLYADKGASVVNYEPCVKRDATGADSWWWWFRSPRADGADWFRYVDGDGGWYIDRANLGWGVSPGFCF